AQRIVASREFWTEGALEREWHADVVFLNPPFSRVGEFVRYAVDQYQRGFCTELFILCRCAPSSSWFSSSWVLPHCHTLFFSRRMRFWTAGTGRRRGGGAKGDVVPAQSSMPHEIAMLYFGPDTIGFEYWFQGYGRIVLPLEIEQMLYVDSNQIDQNVNLISQNDEDDPFLQCDV
ncbi:MAG: hypothetical protein EZS28_017134, partial [Streblomastix strix]